MAENASNGERASSLTQQPGSDNDDGKTSQAQQQAVASLVADVAMTTSAECTTKSTPRRGVLRMFKTGRPVYLPNKERDPRKVQPELRTTIRSLAAGEGRWPLYLWGKAGTGKTCAALALLDFAGGFYFTADDLAETVSDAMMGRLRTPGASRLICAKELWTELATCSLVVIDELGEREKVSDHHYGTLKRLLDRRESMPVVCIGNRSLRDIEQLYGEPVASRLAGGTVFQIAGPDRRLDRGS